MRRLLCLIALGPAALAGCDGPAMAPVRGRVTCNGNPVPDAVVIFSPVPAAEGALDAGKAAQGGTDRDGRFRLSTFKDGDGALVGRHRASVILDNEGRLPCKGKAFDVEVKAGDNDLELPLSR